MDANGDDFPVSPIPAIRLYSSAREKVNSVRVDANCDEFSVSLRTIVPSCSKNVKDTRES